MRRFGLALTLLCSSNLAATAQSTNHIPVDPGSANFWLDVCQEGHAAHIMCIGYVRALYDTNEMLTYLYKRPLWCAPSGLASACSDMPELRRRMAEKYGRQGVQLTFYLEPPRAGK